MKVLLTQDVPKLGQAGEIKDVATGYARNYLIPQKLAEVATPAAIKQVEAQQQAQARREAKAETENHALADRIQNLHLHITARVGTEDRLYGAVTNQEIAERLAKELGTEIDRRKVILENPIRQTGTYQVPVHLARNINPTVTVTVEAAGAPATTPTSEAPAESGTTATQTEQSS